jgi:hypothetical protein
LTWEKEESEWPELNMKMIKPAALLLTILFAAVFPANAVDSQAANDTLLKATSPFEDMVKYALDRKEAKLAKALATANSQTEGIRGALPAAASSRFDTLFLTLQKSATATNHYAIAKTSVEIFHLLIENLTKEGLKIPIEVSWLDYAGFKLHVLASAPKPDWASMDATIEDATKWWEAIKMKVAEKNLRYAMDSDIQGLRQSVKSKNLPMLYFAAQMDLDLVDLLENHFEGKK